MSYGNGQRQNGGGYPERLGVNDLGGATVAVVHIDGAAIVNFGGSYLDKSNQKVAVTFAEFPGKQFVLNRTSYDLLVNRYGDHQATAFRGWEGKLVVLKVVDTNDPRTGNAVKSLWVADDRTWSAAFSEWSKGQAAPASSARKTAARRAGK